MGVDPKEIRELIELISRSNFQSFELEREGFRLRLVKGEPPTLPPAVIAAVAAHAPAEGAVAPVEAAAPAPELLAAPTGDDGLVTLPSPIVGTFYRSPGPEAPAFVEVGSRVKKGQTVCIVEAMKVMNEIESEIDGEVVQVAVANGQPVEYGEILFRLKPL
jgi:acetyl-CoA carboxylase biotin carboxyl carrier protein